MSFFQSETKWKNPIADVMNQPRQDALAMTMYLLGFDPYNQLSLGGQGSGQGVGSRGGGAGRPGLNVTTNGMTRGAGGGGSTFGGIQGTNASWSGPGGYHDVPPGTSWDYFHGNGPLANQPAFGDPTQRLESVFGPLTSPLQRQSVDFASKFLASDPYAKALESLNAQMGVNPGQGVMDALQPRYQQNLAAAHGEGNRFSSGNAIRESQAVNDYNLLSAQALQHGVTQQQEAAKTINVLHQGLMDNLASASALGDTQTQRQIQLLLAMLQTIQGATFGITKQPVTTPSTLDTVGGFIGNVGGAATGLGLGFNGGGGGMPSTAATGPNGWGGDATLF